MLGASGMVGGAVVAEALRRGHRVEAVSRGPWPGPAHPRLREHALDVRREADRLDPVLAEADAAVLAVRFPPGRESLLAETTRGVLEAVARCGTRLLVVGGAGALRTPEDPGRLVVDDPARVPEAWRAVARASVEQLRVCRDRPELAWSYLSPPALLEPGERTGRYRRGGEVLLVAPDGASRITVPDFAIAVLDEAEKPSGERHLSFSSR